MRAALGAFVAALVTAIGLMHSYQVTKFDVISSIQPAWQWVGAYLLMGLVFLLTPLIARPTADNH
jgi:hypothetical protein